MQHLGLIGSEALTDWSARQLSAKGRYMTDGPRPSELPSDPPPEGSGKRKPFRRRIADNWNSLDPADKARVKGVAAAMVVGFIALASTRATAADRDPDGVDGLSGVALIIGPAATERDDTASFGAPTYSGPVDGYWRNQCLNPRGHAGGNCTHERRWVSDYTKGRAA